MYSRYRDQVDFYAMYIREAHPIDGWRMESNERVGIQVVQPKLMAERTRVAERCCAALEMSMPLLVDSIQNEVSEAYSAFPDRLYIIDRRGRVAFKGGRGPFGFHPLEMEQELILLLLEDLGSF